MNARSLILAGVTLAVSLSAAPGFAVDTPANPPSATASPSATAASPIARVRRQRGPNIETLLNLTPDQKTRYQTVQSDFRAKMTALRGSTVPADQKAAQRKQLNADREKSIESILNPTQLTQYKKVMADRMARRKASAMSRLSTTGGQPGAGVGPTALTYRSGSAAGPGGRPSSEAMIARLNATLNLTADQESKIRALLQSASQQRAQLRRAAGITATSSTADRAKLRSEYAALRKQTSSQIRDLLTADQQAKFDAMPRPGARASSTATSSTATGTNAK